MEFMLRSDKKQGQVETELEGLLKPTASHWRLQGSSVISPVNLVLDGLK